MGAEMERPSLLDGLKARREAVLAELIEDVPVPGLPGVVLRIRPVDYAVIERQRTKVAAGKTADARAKLNLNASAAVIAAAVAGGDGCGIVFGAGSDDEEVHTLKDVGDVLLPDADAPNGADVVRALFLRDGDVIVASGKVARHSGFADGEADEEFAGES